MQICLLSQTLLDVQEVEAEGFTEFTYEQESGHCFYNDTNIYEYEEEELALLYEEEELPLMNLISGYVFPYGIIEIGDCSSSSFVAISIPVSVNTTSSGGFRDCCGLTSIIVPSSVTSIGTNAFDLCFMYSITIFGGEISVGGSVLDSYAWHLIRLFATLSTSYQLGGNWTLNGSDVTEIASGSSGRGIYIRP